MKAALFSAALLASGASIAAAPIDGWYNSLFGGVNYLPDNINITKHNLRRHDTSYDMGYNAGGRIGYQSNPLRYEAEITYLDTELDDFKVNHVRQTGVLGESEAGFGMINVYYDFQNGVSSIRPFVGIGLGYGIIKTKLYSTGPLGFTQFSEDDSVYSYQATAGLTYNFAENFALNIAYRYIGTETVDSLGKSYQANLASAGVVYRFDENKYK